MTQVAVTRHIAAPVDVVFRAVTDIEMLPETNPDIVSIKFLSDGRSGVGTRFREIRRMGNKQSATELEVTELVEREHARMVADSHGTVWDTRFTVRPVEGGTELALTMDARAHALLPKLLNPIMKGLFRKGLEKHVDAVRAYCESRPA